MALKVVTANRLSDGFVVYLDREDGWSERIEESRVADNPDEGKEMMALAGQAERDVVVVDPYLIAVSDEDGSLRPVKYRELLRTKGPTVRTDLGKQADRNLQGRGGQDRD